ncbi:MAG TPA: hypothetical protein VD906_04625, partial [Caulobacteraceae bacterium]|nr:hypothetical protein [Caulobacteraceae bacterium]
GVGVAVVDEFTARAEAMSGVDFRPLEPPLRFGVFCMHLEERPLSHLSEAFIRVMGEQLSEAARS